MRWLDCLWRLEGRFGMAELAGVLGLVAMAAIFLKILWEFMRQ